MNRREFLYGTTALTLPVLTGCDNSDEPTVSINTNYPVSPFGGKSTAEEVTVGLDLTGKTALVTGGASGIGYAIAEGFQEAGAEVIVTAQSDESLEKCVDKTKFGSLRKLILDVTNDISIEKSFDEIIVSASVNFPDKVIVLSFPLLLI